MTKYTRFADIPKFVRDGSWECDFTLQSIWRFLDDEQSREGIDLDPDFQRAHVWSEAQQIAWLEFFMRGGKTGRVLYFNHSGWHGRARLGDKLTIVDGKQRLEAIRRFVQNEIPVFGSCFREYTDSPRMNATIKVNINTLWTRAEVIQWYLDLNSGGTPHTPQELEKARELLEKEKCQDHAQTENR